MKKIRNIAIIAHVDHGKTTLVDKILHQCQLFRDNQETGDLILDSNDQEKERGITIFSKNVSVDYKDHKINIIDTPGHADFGGEVERVLNMADGVLLLVDAFEGPMPQTRYVLQKALELNKKPLVIVNKVDKPNCRPDEVYEMVFDLMFSLDATEEQLDFPVVYGSAKFGWMAEDYQEPTDNLNYLLDQVIEHVPAPEQKEGTVQMQITSIDFSSYIGRIAIGKVTRGSLKANTPVSLVRRDGVATKMRTKDIFTFQGLARKKVDEVVCGDLCAITGIDAFDIGDTIADFENPEGLPPISIDEPTMSMLFTVNNSPFFGKEGKFVTSRHIRERLMKETEKNLALKVEETGSADSFNVFGRGVMHLSVLIETMRREGYELQVGKPQVLTKEVDGKKHEPVELLVFDVPEKYSGKVIELVTQRKGELKIMEPKGDVIHIEFEIPSRGIIGLRTNIINMTAGEAVMSHRFLEYAPWKGDIPGRNKGSLIVLYPGTTIPYSMDKLQDRGTFFVTPGVEVYEGQVIGESSRADDLVINVTKTKKLSNMRSSGADDKVKIPPPRAFSLEEAMEYIYDDEYVEITPENVRLRKIFLKEHDRKRAATKAAVV
ncbi:MAG: translational GTPase TypA [Saprospiraceae bacterium]